MDSQVKSSPSKQFLEKYHLNESSHPADWFNALIPLTPHDNFESIEDIDVKMNGSTNFLSPIGLHIQTAKAG